MGQGDHSKFESVTIKIPDPVVAFHQHQADPKFYNKLKQQIKFVITSSADVELPPEYWSHMNHLLKLMTSQQVTFTEEILKYTDSHEVSDLRDFFDDLSTNVEKFSNSYDSLVNGSNSATSSELVTDGLTACRKILQGFSDQKGILFKKAFQTTVFFLAFSAVYRSFSKINASSGNEASRQRKEMECLEDTLNLYKNTCIHERLDNIKMLRSKAEGYAVHDYSYEAQIRKDVSFGGVINDYFDKRRNSEIKFRSFQIADPEEVDRILEDYRNEVKFQYEALFCFEDQTK